MKKILTLVTVIFLFNTVNQAQTLKSLFDKYGDDERFQYVTVNKGMVNMATLFGGMAKDEKAMMAKMKSIKILSLEATSESQIMKSVVHDLDQVLEIGNFETAVEVRDKGERVQIYYRISGADNADMVIVTKQKGEFSLIWISGKMTKQEMMRSFSNNGKIIHFNDHSVRMTDTIS